MKIIIKANGKMSQKTAIREQEKSTFRANRTNTIKR